MDAVRRRLYLTAWMLYLLLLVLAAATRNSLPGKIPSRFDASGTPIAWTDRDALFATQFAILALIIVFMCLIDRILLRRYGETAFMAAICLFMTCVFTLILIPILSLGWGERYFPASFWVSAGLALSGMALAYQSRMRTLRAEEGEVSRRSVYYRRLRPGGTMAFMPFVYPFLPFSISLDSQGVFLRGVLLEARWGWDQIVSVRPGKAAQAYAGSAIRLAASGRDVVVIALKDLRWPLITNAPDREAFLERVRVQAPSVRVEGAD